MKNWNNNSTYKTVSTLRVNNAHDDTVYTYEDYEPGRALI